MEVKLRKFAMALFVLLSLAAWMVQAQTPAPAAGTTPSKSELSAFPPSKAKVETKRLEFDYGYMPNDNSVSCSYWLYSKGEDSLKILRVKPACGCTKAPLKKEVIAPGDSTDVELVFHASAGQRGNVTKSATVTCNDNDRGNFQLRFSANIYPHDSVETLTPLTLSAGSIKWEQSNRTSPQTVVLKNTTQAPITVSLVAQPAGFAEVDLGKGAIPPGKTREVKVSIAKEFAGTDFSKSFTFVCNDQKETRYSVPVALVAQITTIAAPLKKPAQGEAGASEQAGGSH